MSFRLSGINPLSYMGVEPYTPPAMLVQKQAPTVNDFQGINVGTFWTIMDPQELWWLASVAGGSATWLRIYPQGGGGSIEFVCDTGTANPALGILNVLGDGLRVNTSGSGNTITISADGDIATTYEADSGSATPSSNIIRVLGGTNINTTAASNEITVNLNNSVHLTGTLQVDDATVLNGGLAITTELNGVLQTDGSGIVSATNGTNGQVLIGGGTAPVWANITSLGGTVTITNGPNSINLEAEGGGGPAGSVCFAAYQSADYTLPYVPSGGGPTQSYAPYLFGSGAVMTTTTNVGAAFYGGDGAGSPAVFTAPVDGNYFFQMNAYMESSFQQVNPIYLGFIATPGNYFSFFGNWSAAGGSPLQLSPTLEMQASATIPLTTGQQVQFQFAPGNNQVPSTGRVGILKGPKTVTYGTPFSPFVANFNTISGYLL